LCISGRVYDFSSLNVEGRQRLSFFLKTLGSLAKVESRYQNHLDEIPEEILAKYRHQRKVEKDDNEKKIENNDGIVDFSRQITVRPRKDTVRPKGTVDCRYFKADERHEIKTTDLASVPFVLPISSSWRSSVEDIKIPLVEDSSSKSSNKVLELIDPIFFEKHENLDWFLTSIPRISHVITCYSETIILSSGYLKTRNGQLTNLEHLINLSTYKQEWYQFSARFKDQQVQQINQLEKKRKAENNLEKNRKVVNILEKNKWKDWKKNFKEKDMLQLYLSSYNDEIEHDLDDEILSKELNLVVWKNLDIEVRKWASFRAQTVIRTIRGALAYFQALTYRFRLVSDKDFHLYDLVELIVAHQTYGSYPKRTKKKKDIDGWAQRRDDIEWVLETSSEYPILLVYDWEPPENLKKIEREEKEEEVFGDFNVYWKEKCQTYWKKDTESMENYWRDRRKDLEKYFKEEEEKKEETEIIPKFRYATCIKRMKEGKLELVAVLPRMRGLRIGKKDKTQGKAANHINALRAVSGHVIQVSDANMDSWIGEGYKVPWITRQIIDGDITKRELGDRVSPLYRIVGFREYIFTGPMGMVGEAMASAEFVFGTLFQRVLTDPLDVRMHYGHPDFFDAFWVLNRGSLSKGSPNINLSEDVFSGYNVALRSQKIGHSDQLEWQKGRETVFTASSGFLTKISAGSVAIQRSRDMKYMQYSISFFKKMSLFYGGLGSFVYHVAINASISFYVLFFFLASYSGISLGDIEGVGSSLGIEWLLGLGVVSSFGYVIELMLEFGWGGGLVAAFRVLPASSLFYLHQNKCMATSVLDSVRTGKAAYVETGRPNAFDHYGTRLMYQSYAVSHYYPAIEKIVLYGFYVKFSGSGGTLPMIMITGVVLSWILGPVLFCPQISDLNVVKGDVFEAFTFLFNVISKYDQKKPSESMDAMWREKEQKFHSLDNMYTRIIWWLLQVIPSILIWGISFSAFIDYACLYLFLWGSHIFLTITFYYTNFANIVAAFWMVTPIASFCFITLNSPRYSPFTVESTFGGLLFIIFLRSFHHFILILFSCAFKCRIHRKQQEKKELEKQYEDLVKFSFFLFLQYHVHLYAGFVIILFQSVFEICLMIVSSVYNYLYNSWESVMQQGRSKQETTLFGTGYVKID